MSIIIDGIEYAGIIYKIENKITGEVYIGQTTNPRGFNGRYSRDGSPIEKVYKYLSDANNRNVSHNQHLRRSIEIYGFDAFQVDTMIDKAMTKEDLNKLEEYYVMEYDSFKNGYNQTYGGDNWPKSGECKNSKRICQIDMNNNLVKVWDSATDAHNAIGVCAGTVSRVCTGKPSANGKLAHTAGGYIWVFEKDYDPNKDYTYAKKHQRKGEKPVVLLDDDGNIIQEFASVVIAAKEIDICKQSVSYICKHKKKSRKHNLKFKSEYLEEQRLIMEGSCEVS